MAEGHAHFLAFNFTVIRGRFNAAEARTAEAPDNIRAFKRSASYPAVLRWGHASVRQAVTNSGNDRVPPALFFGRIIDQDAIHIPRGLVAAIVPNSVFADAGHNEEAWCDPLVEDARWWILLR